MGAVEPTAIRVDDGDTVVILLCAGDKDSQQEDIASAKTYWRTYKARKKAAKAS